MTFVVVLARGSTCALKGHDGSVKRERTGFSKPMGSFGSNWFGRGGGVGVVVVASLRSSWRLASNARNAKSQSWKRD